MMTIFNLDGTEVGPYTSYTLSERISKPLEMGSSKTEQSKVYFLKTDTKIRFGMGNTRFKIIEEAHEIKFDINSAIESGYFVTEICRSLVKEDEEEEEEKEIEQVGADDAEEGV